MPARKSSRAKRHPVVEVFAGSDRLLIDVLRDMPEPREPLVATMLTMAEAAYRLRPRDEALRLAEAAGTAGADPDLLILFYWTWAQIQPERHYTAQSLLYDRAEGLITGSTPPELKALVKQGRIGILYHTGRKDEALELRRELLSMVPRTSGSYAAFFRDCALMLAYAGYGAEVEEEVRGLAARSPGMRDRCALFFLVHYIETGRLQEADTAPEAVIGGEFYRKVSTHADETRMVLDALLGRRRDDYKPWALALVELLAGRGEKALALAREQAKDQADFLYGYFLDAFNMIRAELATGQAAAARRLIRLRREMGNTHYLDDFFLARADLIEGRDDDAGRRFAAAYRACERYRALPRLELEMRMACEMSPAAAMRLTREALGAGAARTAASAAPAPPEPPAPSRTPDPPTSAGPDARGAERLLGSSPAMRELRRLVAQVAASDVPVLVTGETGSGKDVVARAIHEAGPRAELPFIAVNCAAITGTLLESELFGYERGAFSGAEKAHQGIFETAGRGTVFLDEIGDVSPQMQAALLRVLETGEIRPVGSARQRRVECRVVAATNAPLEKLVEEERFRKDLFFRLRRLEVQVPPLREHAGDVPALAAHFLARGRAAGEVPVMTRELCELLAAYPWPGNIRELLNEIERMRLMNSDCLAYGREHASPAILAGVRAAAGAGPGTRSAPPAQSAPTAGAERELLRGRSPMRHVEELRRLFERHGKLTRAEVAATLGVAVNTATKYLQRLVAEGTVRRVEPTASPRTHYFEKNA